jgi:hypothetical protein
VGCLSKENWDSRKPSSFEVTGLYLMYVQAGPEERKKLVKGFADNFEGRGD